MDAIWRVSFFGEETYRPPYAFDNRGRSPEPRAIIQYGLSGELDWHDAAGHRRVAPRHPLLFTCDEPSRFGLDPGNPGPYRCVWVSLAGAGLDVLWRALVATYGAVPGCDDGRLLVAMRRMGKTGGHHAIHAFVVELTDWLKQQRHAGQRPVERAVELLAADPFRDWSVKRVAMEHDVSREHFTEVFTARFGVPPGTWLEGQRLAYARELLRSTGLGIGEIARRCGLGTARRLSRALARCDGAPASRLR